MNGHGKACYDLYAYKGSLEGRFENCVVYNYCYYFDAFFKVS